MTREELQTLAKAKNVNPATLRRWIREHGEDSARVRNKITASEAGRLGRLASGDAVVWSKPARPPAYRSRCTIFDW